MARPKSKQTNVEKLHNSYLKKKGMSVKEWEDEARKKSLGELAFNNSEFIEHIFDYLREEELTKYFNVHFKKLTNTNKQNSNFTK